MSRSLVKKGPWFLDYREGWGEGAERGYRMMETWSSVRTACALRRHLSCLQTLFKKIQLRLSGKLCGVQNNIRWVQESWEFRPGTWGEGSERLD